MRQLIKDNRKDFFIFLFVLFLSLCLYQLQSLASRFPQLVESYYSLGLAPTISKWLSIVPQFFTGSLAEGLLYGHLIIAFSILIESVFHIAKCQWSQLIKVNLKLASYILVLYCSFMIFWGFHYLRPPIADRLALDAKPRTIQELYTLAEQLIDDAILHQEDMPKATDKPFNFYLNSLLVSKEMNDFSNTPIGQRIGLIRGPLSLPKGVYFSEGMSYLFITGIYMPFTGEANINTHVPSLLIPATIAHELAHQRGIAPEDEANFVAYLVSKQSSNTTLRYSGTMLALIYTMNALNEKAPEQAQMLRTRYSEGMSADFKALNTYWLQYEGEVSKAQERVNDAYLKFNQQASGVASYGEMVDLLLAYSALGN